MPRFIEGYVLLGSGSDLDPRALLSLGDLRLGAHDIRLPVIDVNLAQTDRDDCRSKDNLDPVWSYLGLPIAHPINLVTL
jgi:hypothetical protein